MTDHIFISYARRDEDFVLRLAGDLKDHGLPVWLDQWDIQRGQNWDRAIARGIDGCAVFLIVLSPASVASDTVLNELSVALDKQKRLIPVRLEPCKLPLRIHRAQYLDFAEREYANALGGLLSDLGASPEVPSRSAPPAEVAPARAPVGFWPMVGGALALLVVIVIVAVALTGGERETETPFTPSAGDTWIRPKDGAVMVYVPAGEFLMGSTDDDPHAGDDEKPQHTVYLDAFWIDKHEVTNGQYRKCVEAGACEEPGCWADDRFDAPDQPVVCVDWDDALTYAEWVGGRLPTEAEWEKAARGTGGRMYPWGNTLDGSKLNHCDRNCELDWKDEDADDGYARTAPVGSYPAGASPYGALDMAGNVWEWCQSLYEPYPYQVDDGREDLGAEGSRVLRGGSWVNGQYFARCAYRNYDGRPGDRYDDAGCRVVVAPSLPRSDL